MVATILIRMVSRDEMPWQGATWPTSLNGGAQLAIAEERKLRHVLTSPVHADEVNNAVHSSEAMNIPRHISNYGSKRIQYLLKYLPNGPSFPSPRCIK
jgi:hypothetical protein